MSATPSLAVVFTVAVALASAAAGLAAQPDSLAIAAQRAAAARVEPGDRVFLRVWREPTLTDTFTVDQNYMVVLPKLGPYRVGGLSISAVQDSLRLRYTEYLRNPSIAVTVLRRVGVQGEVKTPGIYLVDVTTTLRELVAMAGGITENGNLRDVSIVRNGQRIRVGQWEVGGPLASDLRSGDQVIVARRSWVSRNVLSVTSTAAVVLSLIISLLKR